MKWLYTIFLGIVEGITEWLPVSSTGHLIIVREMIKTEDVMTSSGVFLYVIQLGAILAVLTVYGGKFNPFSRAATAAERKSRRLLWLKAIVGCVPAGIAGVLLDPLSEKLETWQVVAGALFFYGVAFCVIGRINLSVRTRTVSDIGFGTALAIGAFQTLSIVPGTSRSGSTILGGMIAGCSREAAAEFSFLLAVPVMFGASALKIAGEPALLHGENLAVLLLGAATAYLVSLFVIRFLVSYVKRHTFTVFGVYRIVLAAAVTAFFLLKNR